MKYNFSKIKQQLLKQCIHFVKQKQETIEKSIASNKNDLFSETKSSAGDKHETGRAMIQLEMEKSGQQLVEIDKMKSVLKKISIEKISDVACLGSLIKTTKGTYFLAISIGNINIENENYFVISTQSPIGKELLGKEVDDYISFNSAKILEIS